MEVLLMDYKFNLNVMNIRGLKFTILLLVFCVSCSKLMKKEIIIEETEIGVYFDKEDKELKVLEKGKYKIPYSAYLNRFSLKPIKIDGNYTVLTRDKKEITLTINSKLLLKKENVKQLHLEIGFDFKDKLILPAIGVAVRKGLSDVDKKDINIDSIQKVIKEQFIAIPNFSRFFKVKSLKVIKIK